MPNIKDLATALIDLRYYHEVQLVTRMFEGDKRRYIADVARHSHIKTFIETGTYLGKTTELLATVVDRVISIEIEPKLHADAVEMFRGNPNVQVLLGDSGALMPGILADLTEPALFWLDGHWSGGITGRGADVSPIEKELQGILDHPIKEHVVVIDDARLFRGRNGYPTIRRMIDMVVPSPYRLAIFSDLIRIQREDI